jgi:hypothetical protein
MNDHNEGHRDQPSAPMFPGPVLPAVTDSSAYAHADPPIFDVVSVVSDPSSQFPLAVSSGLPPEVSDISRIIRTESPWVVHSGWSNLGTNPRSGLMFQVSVSRPIQTRFALRFPAELLGAAMAAIHRAGGFTFSCSPAPCQHGHHRILQIITFVVDPNHLLDTLAQLRPSAV